MIVINTASAGIDPVAGQAVPALSIQPGALVPMAVCNLTRNFSADPTKMKWAFDLNGHVKVSVGPGENLSKHNFGFIQYIRHKFIGIFYAGRSSREGSVAIQPDVGSSYMLDCSERTNRPFMWPTSENAVFDAGEVLATMGDHPVLSIGQTTNNPKSGLDNFLFHILDRRDVWSILTVQDPSGNFQHLAHVHWDLVYEFKFKWNAGKPIVQNLSEFKMGTPAKGAPSDPDLTPIFASLSATQTPIANEKVRAALKAALVPPNAGRTDNEKWFMNVPTDFFS
jgi:hypothetical protein